MKQGLKLEQSLMVLLHTLVFHRFELGLLFGCEHSVNLLVE